MSEAAERPEAGGGGKIIVVDDEPSMRKVLAAALGSVGHTVHTTDDGAEALELYASGEWDLLVQDLKMPKMDGLELLRQLKEKDAAACAIVITAFGTWDTAVEAMRLGAYDYIKKPFDNDHLRSVVAKALERRRAGAASRETPSSAAEALTGNDPRVREIIDVIRRIGPTDSTVLITGESGTGKERVARAIHAESLRSTERMIPVNCGAFTETLLESELFGHVRGSFTGAIADKKGLLEVADRGTLFLDEVAEMSPQTQVKLLRVLENRTLRPVGGVRDKYVDVRFIAATNRDLQALTAGGGFREDLYYRLNVIPLELPPLRARKGDIPLLAGQFLAKYAAKTGKAVTEIDESAVSWLMEYDWPGNVRELENSVERAVALTRSESLSQEDVASGMSPRRAPAPGDRPAAATAGPPAVPGDLPEEGINLAEHLAETEREYIRRAMAATGGNLTRSAKLLGMTFRAIRYKVQKYGLK
ncbi:MAG: sigma-54-dependent transcriptional regulator [Planctomycetota bacterium]|jgi:DNA-binding NtrC family response regulator